MKNTTAGMIVATATIAASVLMAGAALAAPQKAPVKSATLKCPSCGMPMPMKKTASMPVPVKIGGKTYYCCSACPSGKAALAALKPAGKKPAGAAAPKKA